ncbi:MAG TPA: hypothetical protein VGN20_20615 [Mucilaginibacter sp.]|jgi:hypothetical protein
MTNEEIEDAMSPEELEWLKKFDSLFYMVPALEIDIALQKAREAFIQCFNTSKNTNKNSNN